MVIFALANANESWYNNKRATHGFGVLDQSSKAVDLIRD